MTKEGIAQMMKNEALNKIRKIYHPKYKFPYNNYGDEGSYGEQREYRISSIIEDLERKLKTVKKKQNNSVN